MVPMMGFPPVERQAEVLIRESFARQGLMLHLGAELAEVRVGACEIRIPFRPELTQQHGYFHAGVTAAIADSACGYSALAVIQALTPRDSALTVEYKINLLAPAQGEWLIARAQVIRPGKMLKICRADVFALNAGKEAACATILSTITVSRRPIPQDSIT